MWETSPATLWIWKSVISAAQFYWQTFDKFFLWYSIPVQLLQTGTLECFRKWCAHLNLCHTGPTSSKWQENIQIMKAEFESNLFWLLTLPLPFDTFWQYRENPVRSRCLWKFCITQSLFQSGKTSYKVQQNPWWQTAWWESAPPLETTFSGTSPKRFR